MEIRIGELARLAQCPVVTIRFYEKQGLLSPARSQGNYRIYGEADIERLRFIIHCRMHDINLAQIKRLLAVRDNPTNGCAAAHQIIDEHIRALEERIRLLTRFKSELEGLKSQGAPCPEDGCPLIRKLNSPDCCAYCGNVRKFTEALGPGAA